VDDPDRRERLTAFRHAVDREHHVLTTRPDLARQQLHNRLAGSVDLGAERHRRRVHPTEPTLAWGETSGAVHLARLEGG
jgi:hypothetical protein